MSAPRQPADQSLPGPGAASAPQPLATASHQGAMMAFKRHLLDALVVLVLISLAGVGWLAYRSMQTAAVSEQWETHSRVVMQEWGDLLSSLQDAETGQRGFIITGNPDYLQPYQAGLSVNPSRLAALRRLTADNPRQQQRLDAVTPLVAAKLAELKETIALRETQGFPAASAAVMAQSGKKIMDQLRVLVAEGQADEAQLLKGRIATYENDTRKTFQSVLLGGGLGTLALLLLFIRLSWELSSRKQAEELAGRQAAELATLYATAPVGLFFYDTDLRYVRVNPAMAELNGLPAELHIGRTLRELLTPELADDVEPQVRLVLETGRPLLNCEVHGATTPRPGEQQRHWLVSYYPVQAGDGTIRGVQGAVQEITERMQAQAALRESEAFSRGIIKSSRDCIKVLDLEANLLSMESGQELLGIEDTQPFLNKSWIDFWENADDKRAAQAAVASAAAGGVGAFVGFFRTLHGEPKWWDVAISPILDANGKPARLLAVSRDVTERQQADDVLRQRTAQFEALLNEAPVGIYLIDADFRIRHANPKALPKFGDIHGLIGRDFAEVMHILWPSALADEAIGQFRHTLETGEPCVVPEMIEKRADRGTIEYYEWQISRIPLPDGRHGVVCYFRDISERVLAQQKIRDSEQRFRAMVLASSDLICRMNPDWSEMLQIYDKDLVVSTHVANPNWLQYFVYRDDQPRLMALVNDAIRTKRPFEMEHRVRRADGSWGWMLSRAVPLLDAKGDIIEWFGTGSDVTEHKRAEQALRESEERYRSLFNSIDEGFAILEIIFDEEEQALDYRFLEVNPAFVKQSGIPDATGKRIREISPDQQAYSIEIYSQILRTGEPSRFVNEEKALGRYFDVYAIRLGGPESRKVAVVFNNITERKAAEEALRASEQRLRALVTASSDVVYRMSPDWREMRQLHGQNFIVDTVAPSVNWLQEYIHPDDQQRVMAVIQEAIRTKSLFEMEHQVRTMDGSPGWTFSRAVPLLDATGEIVEWFGTASDVTEKKRAEQALRESEERLRLAAEAAHFGMYDRSLDGADFHVSGQLKHMLGYAADAPLGHLQVISHFHPDDQAAGLAAFQRACDPAGDGQIAIEQRIVRRDGAVRWIASVGRVLFEDGVAKRSIGFWIDITERNRLQRETLEQAQALADLDRRKDEFLAMLSHELRNPLAALSNAVQLLRLQKNEAPLQQQARHVIERQLGQLKHLVGDLLEISRITSGSVRLRLERVSVGDVVERALETAQPLITKRRHQLMVSLPPQPVWLQADAARLEQVLVNLLTNAAKYSDEGGRIWLSVEQEDAAEAGVALPMVVVKVRDTGIGIAPELLPRIFDLFTQAERSIDRSQGGLGIGLCLVQRLVELHGGTVKASSVLGQGSEFVVRLPVVLTALPPPSPALDTARPPAKGCRVLVVDDNVDAAQSLARLLEMTGHEVQLAYDGPSALAAAIDYRPDVVLLDIGLPGLTGYEVAERMRQQATLKNTVLVALTGYGQEGDRQLSREAGFDHHLVKPADFGEVQKILANVAKSAAGNYMLLKK